MKIKIFCQISLKIGRNQSLYLENIIAHFHKHQSRQSASITGNSIAELVKSGFKERGSLQILFSRGIDLSIFEYAAKNKMVKRQTNSS